MPVSRDPRSPAPGRPRHPQPRWGPDADLMLRVLLLAALVAALAIVAAWAFG